MATFHTVFNFAYYYNVGCQTLSHDRRLKAFSIESVIFFNELKIMAFKTAEDLGNARMPPRVINPSHAVCHTPESMIK